MESSVHQSHYAHGLSSLQLPKNGSSPTVSKVSIYFGQSLVEQRVPPIPYSCFDRNCYSKLIEVLADADSGLVDGLRTTILAEDGSQTVGNHYTDGKIIELTSEIQFGESVESVATKLGTPWRVFYKSEDKMRIHLPPSTASVGDGADGVTQRPTLTCTTHTTADYFYNYNTLGMDILFDAETHTVKKFVMHTNFPGHFDFGIYSRCNFSIKLPSIEAADGDIDEDNFEMNSLTKWEDVSHMVQRGSDDTYQQPVVLNRSSANGITNPFGSTFCYGYRNLILEVMENGHIVTVTIFDPELIN